ncbi:hypothetical protein JCM11641_001541 [Rhodosporidiobolus odoratus]
MSTTRQQRAQAAAHPLRPSDTLAPSSPTIDPRAITTTPGDLAHIARAEEQACSASTNPPRPVNLRLRNLVTYKTGWRSLRLRLRRQICGGNPSWAQVWTATALEGEVKLGSVVVKLLAEALFPDDWPEATWRSAAESEEAELRAYAAYRSLQGRDVPHCYGGFSFAVPWGDTVTGIVLEDLDEVSSDICEYCEERIEHVQLQDRKDIRPLVTTAYSTLHRLQGLGVGGYYHLDPGDIRILHSSTTSETHLVFLDFGQTRPVDYLARIHAEANAKEHHYEPWQADDEGALEKLLRQVLGSVVDEWVELEAEERGLTLFSEQEVENVQYVEDESE